MLCTVKGLRHFIGAKIVKVRYLLEDYLARKIPIFGSCKEVLSLLNNGYVPFRINT